MAEIRDYRDLRAWQLAMDAVPAIYRVANQLPDEETFGLGSQLRRAAVSIPANISEGHARGQTREFLRFACIARGSLAELETLLELSRRLGYAQSQPAPPLDELRRSLYGLTSALRRKLSPAP
jgi:four helix bundle protein